MNKMVYGIVKTNKNTFLRLALSDEAAIKYAWIIRNWLVPYLALYSIMCPQLDIVIITCPLDCQSPVSFFEITAFLSRQKPDKDYAQMWPV